MDDKRSKAVTEAFVKLYKQGLIYRDLRLVNWDCVLRTAISDIEVDYIDIKERTLLKVPGYDKPVEFGVLTKFAYTLEGSLGEVVVATTRIETMLGDTAIAVNPADDRYSQFHGKYAVHPFNGRKLPIICDAILVDPKFRTGAVKITPAHDPNGFEVGKHHDLEFINVFTDDGKINSNGGSDFLDMPRFKAREAITEALRKKGLYRGSENNEMRLGVCSRSNDVIEPMIKPQWYVNCSDIAKEALNAVTDEENKRVEIFPKQYAADWKRWLENIHDWCISRQLWWGHQIPAWYVTLEDDTLQELGAYHNHWIVARNEEEARDEASQKYSGKKFSLSQDPDVLDTWFSSGLFPLTVLGWPDDSEDLKAFYPTSVLETGHDILFFWVARIVMLGMKLAGDVPFSKIYLHPMIRDAQGRKMSKSLVNVIDPIEVINGISLEGLHMRLEGGNLDPKELSVAIESQKKDFPNGIDECGADALRFSLVSYTAQSDKINLDIQRVVGYRQWCNKLWNAVRFAMSKLGDDYIPPATLSPDALPFSCQWILSVLNKTISKTNKSLGSYEFSQATTAVYSWWQYQLCDVFIEVVKPYFSGNDPKFTSERRFTQYTLWFCLDNGLRLLHPFMPFVTEELWQRLPSPRECKRAESIMIADYPSAIEGWNNEGVESEMYLIEATVKSLRSLAKESCDRRPAFVLCRTQAVTEIINSRRLEITTLANLSSLTVITENEAIPSGYATTVVNGSISVYLELQVVNSAEAELGRKRNKIDELNNDMDRLAGKKPEDTSLTTLNVSRTSFAGENKLSSDDLLREIAKRTGSRLDATRFGSVCTQFRSLKIRYLPILPKLDKYNFVFLQDYEDASWRMQSLYLINPPPNSHNKGGPWIVNMIQSSDDYENSGPIYGYQLWHPIRPADYSGAQLTFHRDNIFNRALFDFDGLSIIDLGQHLLFEEKNRENICTEKTAWIKDENVVVVVPKHFDQRYAFYFRESNFDRITLQPAGSKWDDLCIFKLRPYLVDITGRTIVINSDLTTQLVAESLFLSQSSRKYLVVNRGVEELILVCHHFMSQTDNNRFKLFKLNETEKVWVEIFELGDRAIFLGNSSNFIASASELWVTTSNVIVFWEYYSPDFGHLRQYNLDDHSVTPLYQEFSRLFWPAPIWVNDRLNQLPFYKIWIV